MSTRGNGAAEGGALGTGFGVAGLDGGGAGLAGDGGDACSVGGAAVETESWLPQARGAAKAPRAATMSR
jgi:hypothetical protein